MAEIKFTVDEAALQTLSSTEITANFEETKTALEEMVRPYKGVLVDSSNLRETKADIARIRKVEKSIDDYRKMVKKYVLVPVTAFEDKCKELKAVCTDAVVAMDTQVKEIEQQQKEAKIEALREFFDEVEKKYPEYMSFDAVRSDTWENKTCPIEKAQQEILEYIGTIERDIDIILSLKSEDEEALLMRYAEHGDLRDVMDYNQALVQRKQRAEQERIAREQEEKERAEREAAEMLKAQEPVDESEPPLILDLPFEMPKEIEGIPSKTVGFSFDFCGTPSEIAHVEESLISIGIRNYRMIYK